MKQGGIDYYIIFYTRWNSLNVFLVHILNNKLFISNIHIIVCFILLTHERWNYSVGVKTFCRLKSIVSVFSHEVTLIIVLLQRIYTSFTPVMWKYKWNCTFSVVIWCPLVVAFFAFAIFNLWKILSPTSKCFIVSDVPNEMHDKCM